jgi:hypothetical protein
VIVNSNQYRDRSKEILFIDARNLGHLINRRTKVLSDDDIKTIADTYHNWRNKGGDYEDVAGFCASVDIDEVAKLDYVLTPGRYVGLADEEDDFDFKERFTALKAEFEAQLEEEAHLNKSIAEIWRRWCYELVDEVSIKDICDLITVKTNIKNASIENYISTENMLPNFGGVEHAEKLPTSNP